MNNHWTKLVLVATSVVFIGTALAHLSCIYFGPSCYRLQMAPEFAIRMAEDNWVLASSLNILVSSLFVVAGVYVLGTANIFVKLPFLSAATLAISTICVARGIATLPLYYLFPGSGLLKSILVGFVWLIVGLGTFIGYRNAQKNT